MTNVATKKYAIQGAAVHPILTPAVRVRIINIVNIVKKTQLDVLIAIFNAFLS